MRELFKNKNLKLLCSAIIFSATGSWLLLYALSTSIYFQTGSLVASSLVYFSKIIPSALAGIFGGNFADRIKPKHFLRILNIACFFLTLLYLLPVDAEMYWLLYLLIGVRSFFDHAETMGREVSVVYFFRNALQLKANTLINTTNLVSMALACSAGILLLQILPLKVVIIIDAVTFLISAAILSFLTEEANHLEKRIGSLFSLRGIFKDTKVAWNEILTNRMIQDAIMYGAIFGIFLEGSRFVFHHYMGLMKYQIGASGVSLIVSVEALGMILGGLITGILANWLIKGHYKLIFLLLVTCLSYALQITSSSSAYYIVFLFWTSLLYQIFDIHTINMMIASCPPHLLGKVSGLWIKFFALPTISILNVVAAKIIPVMSNTSRIFIFIGTPLAIIGFWEVYKRVAKVKKESSKTLEAQPIRGCETL